MFTRYHRRDNVRSNHITSHISLLGRSVGRRSSRTRGAGAFTSGKNTVEVMKTMSDRKGVAYLVVVLVYLVFASICSGLFQYFERDSYLADKAMFRHAINKQTALIANTAKEVVINMIRSNIQMRMHARKQTQTHIFIPKKMHMEASIETYIL